MKSQNPAVLNAAIILLIAAQALFVAAYIGSERTIYFWDHAMYLSMAREAYEAFGRDFSAGWKNFQRSFAGNYNLIFALPSFVSFKLFGTSRMVFILTNFLVFFLGYEIAVAFFLRVALKCEWRIALILSLVSAVLIPPLWLPLLEGYADSGAAACLVFAAALALSRPVKQPAYLLKALLVGIVSGFAVLLRRHFVYPTIAMFITLGIFALWDIRGKKNFFPELLRIASYFAVCGIGFAGIIYLIAPDFFINALTINYSALYFSYKRAPLVFIYFLLGGFGFLLLLAAAGGLVLLARINNDGKRLALFTTIFTLLWLVIWCLGPDQMGHHYVLHALPLLVSTGLAGWYFYLIRQPKKLWLGCVIGTGLLINSAWALWLSPNGVWPNDNGTPGIFSAVRPPVVRTDYDEWMRLANYLHQKTNADDRIFMVGSSFVFNQDLLRAVFTDILNAPEMIFHFVRTSEIDHEEPAPLNSFAAANVYVVPTPAQYHLDPAGQRVVTSAAKEFPPPATRASIFHKDDEIFHLADGVTVNIWRRDAWKPALLRETLAQMRKDGPQDPNFVQDWATTRLPLQAQIFTNDNNHTFVTGIFEPLHKTMRLFFDYPLAAGAQNIAFNMMTNCPDPKFGLTIVSGDGHVEVTKDFAHPPGEISQNFTVAAQSEGPRYLELEVTTAAESLCRLDLNDLRIEMQP